MHPPDKLRIPFDEYHFPYTGRCVNGIQFLGYITGAWPGRGTFPDPAKLHDTKHWLAVLHLFDADGNHIRSESRLGGYDVEGREIASDNAFDALSQMLEPLGLKEPELGDIWVRPFQVELDGIVHGLFFEQDDEEDLTDPENGWVMLEPRDIMFHRPWDSGNYST